MLLPAQKEALSIDVCAAMNKTTVTSQYEWIFIWAEVAEIGSNNVHGVPIQTRCRQAAVTLGDMNDTNDHGRLSRPASTSAGTVDDASVVSNLPESGVSSVTLSDCVCADQSKTSISAAEIESSAEEVCD